MTPEQYKALQIELEKCEYEISGKLDEQDVMKRLINLIELLLEKEVTYY